MKQIRSLSEFHRLLGLGKPKHPLISLIYDKDVQWSSEIEFEKLELDFYIISLKYHEQPMKYGRNFYDFEEGTLVFTAPNQIIETFEKPSFTKDLGWALIFKPELIQSSVLGEKIKEYDFFYYDSFESLHMSEQENEIINDIVKKVKYEYELNLDKHSHALIVSHLEVLLQYCNRFYERQFLTRSPVNSDVLSKFEKILSQFYSENKENSGLPSVQYCAECLNYSPKYLSNLLKVETGKNAQEHIHQFILNRAKNKLLYSTESISEIAYDLGFDYPQSFTRFFKAKEKITPNQFRMQN
ncbi:helix-turn-helix domain-containing protein [Aureivirga marina]|uniref:helix-turn-helix domain-containing protein n=1 Tax=Aureivirga marina TaxID=1182451 RepID=UPI0018C98DF2|nr:helix-turn-helix domain-containing protein [Aureivirga marina]